MHQSESTYKFNTVNPSNPEPIGTQAGSDFNKNEFVKKYEEVIVQNKQQGFRAPVRHVKGELQ